MKIYLDAMGGDNAPQAPAEGAREALERYEGLEIELAGPIEQVKAAVDAAFQGADPALRARLVLTDCPEVITNCEAPVMAVRRKKQSAIVDGMLKLRDGKVDAFVSAGSTGAVLSGGMFRLGRLRGIDRPALAPPLPNGKGYFLLIDCGANVDCRPEYLHQFAMMGSAYMQGMRGIQSPRIGLVNNGAEAEKGCALTKEAYALLAADKRLNFVGNVEAREITHDQADVIVCDGFVGNVLLKSIEGTAAYAVSEMAQVLKRKLPGADADIVDAAAREVMRNYDYNSYGGAYLLGCRKPIEKIHGAANERTIPYAVGQMRSMILSGMADKISEQLDAMSRKPVSE